MKIPGDVERAGEERGGAGVAGVAGGRGLKAIICDIDGCLGPESHAPMNAGCLAEIAAMNRRAIGQGVGPIITLCSGRPQPFVEAVCRVIGNDGCPAIAEMGVWLYDAREGRAAFERDPNITKEHLRAVREATGWIESELVPRGVVIQPGKSASISLWHAETAYLLSLKPQLVERFALEGWGLRVSSTVAWINCDLEHVSKATGIARMKLKMGFERAELAGIGDTMGDRAIAEAVGFFGVPANAEEGLKAHAHYISPYTEMQGVLDIISKLPVLVGA